MGCGSSAQVAPAGQKKELTQEDINAIAVQGLKAALVMAMEHALAKMKDVKSWEDPKFRIVPPMQKSVEAQLQKVRDACEACKIPLLPGQVVKIVDAVDSKFKELSGDFAEAAATVVQHPGFRATYTRLIAELSIEQALDLCTAGAVGACTDYLEYKAREALNAGIVAVIDHVLKEHQLKKSWDTFAGLWNDLSGIVGKLSIELDPIKFNLEEFIADKTLKGFKNAMYEKETEIRAAPQDTVHAAIQQAFNLQRKPASWRKVKEDGTFFDE